MYGLFKLLTEHCILESWSCLFCRLLSALMQYKKSFPNFQIIFLRELPTTAREELYIHCIVVIPPASVYDTILLLKLHLLYTTERHILTVFRFDLFQTQWINLTGFLAQIYFAFYFRLEVISNGIGFWNALQFEINRVMNQCIIKGFSNWLADRQRTA